MTKASDLTVTYTNSDDGIHLRCIECKQDVVPFDGEQGRALELHAFQPTLAQLNAAARAHVREKHPSLLR